ncbi:GNAT family N-acetyltransferase [Stappia stellulata]|uniref:GNAT family N-acetyltransferase n=1 Tax=Stappia stellulata TaxID=71235 RepID=UPI00040672B3|nr:GNAT family N-acetyltransferase [Stappia stellulata]
MHSTSDTIHVRRIADDDLPAVLAINEACLPAVNGLTADALRELVAISVVTLVACSPDGPVGVLVCLDHDADYDSRNFDWLKQSLTRFTYVDRIALAPGARGKAVGRLLYRALLDQLASDRGRAELPLACEVNTRPPNPGSLRFHGRLGFIEIGSQEFGDKAVAYLARDPKTAPDMEARP